MHKASILPLVFAALAACADPSVSTSEEAAQQHQNDLGSVTMPLVVAGQDAQYRLGGTVTFTRSDRPDLAYSFPLSGDNAAFNAPLIIGSYTATLSDWTLARSTTANPTPVDVTSSTTLLTPSVSLTVQTLQASAVRFQFSVAGTVVVVDPCVPDPRVVTCPTGDTDRDGIPNGVECPTGGIGIDCPDTDRDGIPDYFDSDSDGDGTPDATDQARVDSCLPEPAVAACANPPSGSATVGFGVDETCAGPQCTFPVADAGSP
jgi:hypothetical protein